MMRDLQLLAGFATLLAAGCAKPGFVTGGGDYHSAGGLEGGEIEFTADSCADTATGRIELEDPAAIDFEAVHGVELEGTVVSTFFCSGDLDPNAELCRCGAGYQEINFTYVSENALAPGTGEGIACMADIGEDTDRSSGGIALVLIESGPYLGYYNVGSAPVTQHGCPVVL